MKAAIVSLILGYEILIFFLHLLQFKKYRKELKKIILIMNCVCPALSQWCVMTLWEVTNGQFLFSVSKPLTIMLLDTDIKRVLKKYHKMVIWIFLANFYCWIFPWNHKCMDRVHILHENSQINKILHIS